MRSGKLGVRELVLIGVFGALWGAVEMSLGAVLHSVDIPFRGTVLTGIGMIIVLAGRIFVPRRGSTFLIGVVAALMKLLSIGGNVLSPMLAILIEAGLAEIALTLWGEPSRKAFVTAGAVSVLWAFFHPFLSQGILAGRGITWAWEVTIERGAEALGLSPEAVAAIAILLIAIRLLVGGIAGWLGWDVGKLAESRLRAYTEADKEA